MKAAPAIALSLVMLFAVAPDSPAASFTIEDASVEVVNDIYMLDARIDYELSDEAVEALDNGVNLTIRIEVEFSRRRKYIWDPVVARTVQTYRLERHELSGRYVVVDTISGIRSNFGSLEEATDALGDVAAIPVTERKTLKTGYHYRGRVKTSLDIEELPAPLRPIAYISPSWHLGSGWYKFDITP